MPFEAGVAERIAYPFPAAANPLMLDLQRHTDNHLYENGGTLSTLPSAVREIYKKAKTAHMTSWWYPEATWDRIQPIEMVMNWSMVIDDICDLASYEETQLIGQKTVAILRGEMSADEAGILLGWHLERIRQEFLRFIPPASMDRFANSVEWFFQGMAEETSYQDQWQYPSTFDYFTIRDRSICLFVFWDMSELESGITIPLKHHYHPLVMRLKTLASRMVILCHDLQSVDRDEASGSPDGLFNYVRVLRHHHGMSRTEATEETIRLHNAYVAEYVRLQETLPDFGEWTDAVADLVRRISVCVHGWLAVDPDVFRYSPDASGCVAPIDRKALVRLAAGLDRVEPPSQSYPTTTLASG